MGIKAFPSWFKHMYIMRSLFQMYIAKPQTVYIEKTISIWMSILVMKIDYSCVENVSNTLHNAEEIIQEI